MLHGIDEANQGFGAPRRDEDLEFATLALLSCARTVPTEVGLAVCRHETEKVGSRSYRAALEGAMAVARSRGSTDPEAFPRAMRELFHAAARVGEVRALNRLADSLEAVAEAPDHAEQ